MNFKKAFLEGQQAKNKGLPVGKGLEKFGKVIGNVQKRKIYTIGAGPKVGKSTFVDSAFCLGPILYVMKFNKSIDIEIAFCLEKLTEPLESDERELLNKKYEELSQKKIYLDILYFSWEIDRVTKEFDFVVYFLYELYEIENVILPENKKFDDKNYVPLSSQFLRGECLYDNSDEIISVPTDIVSKIKFIYSEYIIPLFGEYDDEGKKVSNGYIYMIEERENPTGVRNRIISYAESRGKFSYREDKFKDKTVKRVTGYKYNNPNHFTIIIFDHVRKVLFERGWTQIKQAVDKLSEYEVDLRNLCDFTFVNIVHINRDLASVQRRVLDEDRIYPGPDLLKDTGNLSEDSNYVITMFNPMDDKFNLKKHFGMIIRDTKGNKLYPNLRTIHLVESRNAEAPQHIKVLMYGAIKHFKNF
jgi:hypothetical protein